MKISLKTDYALRVLLELSLNYRGSEVPYLRMKDISEKHNIPNKFLQQIILWLKKLGYVKTFPGVKGGISLAVPPKEIFLDKVLVDLEGDIFSVRCLDKSSYRRCSEENCVFSKIFLDVAKKAKEVVSNISFEDIVKRYSQFQKKPVYFI